MSKAIQGLAEIGGAVALGATAFFLASTGVGIAALPALLAASGALGLGGIGMEAAAIADKLTTNRGANITIRQPAGYRQIIYGTQRVGGTMVYVSTTGSRHDQVNYVIPIAGHPCDSIVNVYLDGRQVFFEAGSVGNSTRNGVNFGGHADGNDHTGPDGSTYNFGGIVYFEACYGDQTNQPNTVPGGGYNTGLHANDPTWAPDADGVPYLGGCTYVYFKYVYNSTMFPQPPEVRFTVRGKNDILDPRTGLRGYTSNAALVCADVLVDNVFGFKNVVVNQAQLIAAANICDEQVALAAGGTESRYACHYHYDTSTEPGAAFTKMLSSMGGRHATSGGEVYIFPAAWVGPSFQFNDNHLASGFTWIPTRARDENFNRVTGVYTAANYPYNATTENGSNLYDPNGFYDGTLQNNFGYAFQASSIPYYAEDALHGFAANQWLLEDDGELLPHDVDLTCVLSVSQAQRLLKIMLRRNRMMQGNGTLMMFPAAFQMMQLDVMQFTMSAMGWTEKVLEVASVSLGVSDGANGVPCPQVKVGVRETSASIYEWDVSEELSTYLVPVSPQGLYYAVAPPTNLQAESSPLFGLDGLNQPRIKLSWGEPEDVRVTQVEMASQGPIVTGVAAPAWVDHGAVSVASTSALVGGLVAGQVYNFRVRSVRGNGASSAWVELDGFPVSVVLSQLSQTGVGVGSLVSQAFADGTASLEPQPFTAFIGSASVNVAPTNVITGLTQSQLWYVYYVDPAFAGGAVTAIATQDVSDFRGKPGYFLIDSKVTSTYLAPGTGGGSGGGTGGGGASIYLPTMFVEGGNRSTLNPDGAYDGDVASFATISGTMTTNGSAPIFGDGIGTWSGFAATTLTSDCTLYIDAQAIAAVDGGIPITLWASIGSAATTLLETSSNAARMVYNITVPAGTDLSTVSFTGTVTGSDSPNFDSTSTLAEHAFLRIFNSYIQP